MAYNGPILRELQIISYYAHTYPCREPILNMLTLLILNMLTARVSTESRLSLDSVQTHRVDSARLSCF